MLYYIILYYSILHEMYYIILENLPVVMQQMQSSTVGSEGEN